MSDTGNEVFVEFVGNPEQLAAELARALENRLGKAIGEIQSDFTKIFTSSQATSGLKKVAAESEKIGKGWRIITDHVNAANLSAKNFAKTMSGLRTPEQQFREFVRLTDRAEESLDDMRAAEQRIADNPALGVHFRSIQQGAERLAREAGLEFRTLSEREQTAFRKMAEQRRVTDQGATTRARAEASERIVIAQQEGAKIVAETRASGARRVAIIQAVSQQIRALERGLAAVFRTSASLFGSLARGAASSVSRMASIFRRGDARLDDTLDNAMNRRASILRGGLARQEAILATSVTRQSVQIQRLETRLSTGVLGAATGRSALGGLLGGGLAIGGGFAAVTLLRNLATAGADFTQGLAVLDAQLGLTDRQLAKVRQTALDLGNDITLPGVSALDAAQAIQILTKQFGALGKGAVPAATAAAKGTLQLARAAQTSAENAGRVIGSAVNVFGISADKAVQVADQIAGALTVAAGVGFDQFAQSFQQGASVFAAFQVPALGAEEALTQFNTALAVLARQGLVGSDVGTSLKQFFLSMVRNTAPAKKALNEIADAAGVAGSVFFDESGNARALSDSLQIMRDGLADATEQQRLQALQVIFGSDAVRVANALLKTNAEQYEQIRQKIVQQGLAAKIAAAQNQGLRGAMDALNSVIETQGILVYEKLNKTVGNVVLVFADFANKLFSASGGFAVARRALLGIAAGLGALLAFKTGVEVVRLLGVALGGLLTPVGLIAVAFAGIGAAISILLDRSEAFRQAFDRIRETLGNLARLGIDFIQEKLGQLGNFILRTVIPPVSRFIEFIAENALTGLQSFAQLIARNVIPPLADFVNFIAAEVVPVVRDFFVNAFNSARDAVVSFWQKVSPVLQPAIRGLQDFAGAMVDLFKIEPSGIVITLGSALAGALGGFALGGPAGAAIGGLGAGLAALFATGLADNLGAALSGLGGQIIKTLKVPFRAALGFITGFFSADRLEGFARGFLDVVERVGFIIGNIATDPRVLAGVAAAATGLALIGLRLAQGLARGIIDNLDDVAQMVRDGLAEALQQAFGGINIDLSDSISRVIVVGLAAAIGGTVAVRLIGSAAQRLGLTAGKQFGEAMAKGTASSLTVAGAGLGAGPKGLIQGLLGGPSAIAAAQRDAGRISGAMEKEFRRNLNLIQTTGGSTFDLIKTSAEKGFGAAAQASRSAVSKIEANLGTARTAGVRANIALGNIAGSLRNLDFRGVAQGFGDLKASLSGQGRNIGVAAGTAIAASIGVAFGVEMLNQSKSISDAVQGIVTIVGSALLSLAVGNGPLAVVTLGLGSIVAVLKLIQGQSDEAKARVQSFLDAIQAADPEGKAEAIRQVWAAMFEGMDPKGIELLQKAGVNLRDLTDVAIRGGPAVDGALGTIRQNLEAMELPASTINVVMGLLAQTIGEVQTAANKANLLEELGGELDETSGKAVDTRTAWEKMWAPVPDRLGVTLDETNDKLIDGEELADKAREAIDRLFGKVLPPAFKQAMDDLLISLKDFPSQLEGIDLGTVIGKAEVRSAADAKAREFLDVLNQGIQDGAITSLPQVRANRRLFLQQLTEQLSKGGLTEAEAKVLLRVTATVDEATTKREFRRSLQATKIEKLMKRVPVELRPAFVGLSARELQKAIKAQIEATTPQLGAGTNGPFGMARGIGGAATSVDVPIAITPVISVSQSSGADAAQIGQSIAKLVAIGVASASGVIASALGSSIAGALRSGSRSTAAFAQAGVATARALAVGILSQAGAVTNAGAVVADAAAAGAASRTPQMLGAGVNAGAGFSVGVLSQAGGAVGAGAVLASAAGAGASSGSLFDEGLNLAYSMAAGINAGASTVINAAISMANRAASAARAALGIRSPSTVFRNIGRDIGRGLARGLADSEATISSAVEDAVSGAIEAAQNAFGRGRIARASAAARLFEELQPRTIPGGPTANDVSTSVDRVFDQIGVLVQIQEDVREQNEDIKNRNADIRDNIKDMKTQLSKDLQAIRETRVTRVVDAFARRQGAVDIARQRIEFQGLREALRRALNESSRVGDQADGRFDRSLNRGTERGQANIGVILDFGQRIRDFAAQLLESGASARRVTNEVGRYRDALIRQATAMGFNRGQVLDLIKTLGLSERQLRNFVNASQRIGESVQDQIRQARAAARDAIAEARDELERRARVSTSLSRNTAAGRANRSVITDALASIREFGQTALEAGQPVETVVARMREMRRELVQQAVSMGFNRDQIRQLVELMGLSNSQLADFIENLGDLNDEIENPPVPPGTGLTIGPGDRLPEGFRDLHVHLPFGDPEAVAHAVSNRLAFELPSAS